ncbi:IS30 family transposase [Ureaplasma ceti]|uniref:Integrase catalytic domain-containing protein n=1 Tax=Ureaplasma ceti TaxID=3119530 RepID=A0ABP9U4X2_9BACT
MPIWVRPKYIDLRQEFGHWELDLVIGKKANGFDNIITFTERKTRMLFVTRLKSKNPMKVNSALWKLIKDNHLYVKTITTDNGIEFEKIGLLANWADCLVYYCEPFASYQKGSNENINGLIRRFYKKGTSFNDVTDEELLAMQNQINLMDREMFNWTSSYQMYQSEMKKMNH